MNEASVLLRPAGHVGTRPYPSHSFNDKSEAVFSPDLKAVPFLAGWGPRAPDSPTLSG